MNLFRLIALAAALLTAAPAVAQFQVPDHSVPIGRGNSAQGFKNAAPGPLGYPLVSNNATTDPSFQRLPNAGLAPGAANTVKGSVDGVATSDLAIASCSAIYQFTQWVSGTGWRCGILPVLPSRAVAATLDLSAFTAVSTMGYATPGDGGRADFVKTVATAFLDNSISSGTIAANGTGGCTNGTYLGQVPIGFTGYQTVFSITVAGNIVTAIVNTSPGNAIANGASLSFTVPGCVGTVQWTVTGITAATGSFTDSAANKWQINMPAGGLDARAMGIKFDWSVTAADGGSTDNFTAIQNAYNFAAYAPGFIDTGSSTGGKILFPRGTAMFCGTNGTVPLKIWQGVVHQGQGATASVIKPCDAWINTTNFIELCDTASHIACFSAAFRDAQLFTTYTVGQGSASATTQSVFYTNSCQHQGCGIYNATVYPGACRQGVKAEFGYGGAAMVFLINEVEIKGGMKDANCAAGAPAAVSISGYGSTIIGVDGLNIGGLSAASTFGPRSNGLAVTGGYVLVNKLYAENVIAPVISNIIGPAVGFVNVKGFDSGTACVNGVLRAGGSTANTVKLEAAFANSCTNTYNNAGAGSGAINQLADVVF